MTGDSLDLTWSQSFDVVVYSRNELYRYEFEEILVLKHGDKTCKLKQCGNAQILTIEFHTHDTRLVNDAETIRDDMLTDLKLTLLLLGHTWKITERTRLILVNPPPGQQFRTISSQSFGYRIEGQTRKFVPDNSSTQNVFENVLSCGDLKMVAERIDRHSSFSPEIADFIHNWIEFNKMYNPQNLNKNEKDMIVSYVDNLPPNILVIMCNRNNKCISKYPQPINSTYQYDTKNLVLSSLLRIYQIRNNIFHAGKFNMPDLNIINNFLFDLVNNQSLPEVDRLNLTQYYDTP